MKSTSLSFWGLPPKNYFSKSGQTSASLQMNRPSAMPHQEYTLLTKEQQRNLPHSKDRFINVEGHPQLVLRYGQVGFKTPDHGKVHDLPVNKNGKTLKTEENIDALMDSLESMPNRTNIQWFDNGMYQGGTERGYPAVHIYDEDKRVIAVFKKSTGQFTTTCRLTLKEERFLLKTGNFVTEAVMNNQNIQNITIRNKNDF